MAYNHRNQDIQDPYRRDPNMRREVAKHQTPAIVPLRVIKADIRIGRG